MTTGSDRQDRRDARTVETVLALLLGVVTFLALGVGGWLVDHALRALVDVSLAPVARPLLLGAAGVGVAVVVARLVRARRRGL